MIQAILDFIVSNPVVSAVSGLLTGLLATPAMLLVLARLWPRKAILIGLKWIDSKIEALKVKHPGLGKAFESKIRQSFLDGVDILDGKEVTP